MWEAVEPASHSVRRQPSPVSFAVLAGMFFLAAALLLLEITTTRMLSVAMAYHFAVLSISLAMLGLAVGGVFVYVSQSLLAKHGALKVACVASVVSAAAILFALLAFLGLPLQPAPSTAGLMNILLLFLPQSLPYLAIGVAMSTLLASSPQAIATLYFADLLGAATGCVASVVLLPLVGGGGTVLIAGLLAIASGAFLYKASGRVRLPKLLDVRLWASILGLGLILATFTRTFELTYVKGMVEPRPEKIAWTTHSRVSFSPSLDHMYPFGWGFGGRFDPRSFPTSYRRAMIDGLAETPILKWPDQPEALGFLLWDVSSLPYLLKSEGRALIIGTGGGRDIATAHISGRWKIDGAEINPAIVRGLRKDYGDYSGHVYSLPEVDVRVLDGRSALETARPGTYDLVQMSAVDTWAAGSTGALALMENSLYTVESFQAILRCLKPDGYLSVSRFKYPMDNYGETVRMVAVALKALENDQRGTAPSSHLLLVTNTPWKEYRIATMLVKPTPFTTAELGLAQQVSKEKGFGIVWPGSGESRNPAFLLLSARSGVEREQFYERYPIDVFPTTDDHPYFFHQTRLATLARIGGALPEMTALRLVPALTILRLGVFLLVMCAALILYPLTLSAAGSGERAAKSSLAYFAALGIGFMLYEIPLVQQLTLGLGHPSQALSVALAGLLLGTGIGSFLTRYVPEAWRRAVHFVIALLVVAIGLGLSLLGERVTHALLLEGPIRRTVLALILTLAVGVALGMLFPLGVRGLVANGSERSIAWCWAANGAAGVLAAVLALILGTELGMRATFRVGSLVYLMAALVVLFAWPPTGEATPRNQQAPLTRKREE